jgi:hypothetical protein
VNALYLSAFSSYYLFGVLRARRKRLSNSLAIFGAARFPSEAVALPLITNTLLSGLVTVKVNVKEHRTIQVDDQRHNRGPNQNE